MAAYKERFFLNYGPMQILLQAEFSHANGEKTLLFAAEYAKEQLRMLTTYKQIAFLPQNAERDMQQIPDVLKKMLAAVELAGDVSLTPMAAVAGAMADQIADFLQAEGATRILVNNGGDIAIRLQAGEKVRIGLQTKGAIDFLPVFEVAVDENIGGIATSGLGGRSLSKGIANAAMVTAASAALADACATSFANAVYEPHKHIRLVRAEELDPLTDIRGHFVVKEAGVLPLKVIQTALENGGRVAEKMLKKGVISKAAAWIGTQGIFLPEGAF